MQCPVYAADSASCKILSTELEDKEWLKGTPIRQSGNYCLPADVTAYRSDGGNNAGIIEVQTSNVTIDLQNHRLNVKSRGQPAFTQTGKPIVTHITVRNGVLKSFGMEGMRFAGVDYLSFNQVMKLIDFLRVPRKECESDGCIRTKVKLDELNNKLAKIRNNFPLTEHIIDNIKVSAEDIGVGISGGGNIIRNSVIMIGENNVNWGKKTPQEVFEEDGRGGQPKSWGGGSASIYLFGPNQLIENNIIIFKGKTRTSSSSAAPIKIHAADGTIIRNNTIIIESSGEDIPQTAISIFDSKNVVIENNKIFGTKSVYKIWDEEDKGSSVKESGTTFPSFWKKPNLSF